MSRTHRAHSSLTSLVESDSDDAQPATHDTMPTPDSSTENMRVRKNGNRSKAAAIKVSKAKDRSRCTSGRVTGAQKDRQVLKDKTNAQIAQSDTEEVDEFDQEDAIMVDNTASVDELDASLVATKPKRGRPAKGKISTKFTSATKGAKRERETTVANSKTLARSKAQSKEEPLLSPLPEDNTILETQASVMDLDHYGDKGHEEPTAQPVAQVVRTAGSDSRSRQTSLPRRRAGSASDTERSDPVVRRKLGDMTKKYDQLDLRYRNLREIGVKQAEQKFEQLRRQSEQSKKAANDLIASLKAEIASQNVQLKTSRAEKIQRQKQDAKITTLQANIAKLTTTLSESNIENKTLSAKLAATRNAAASVESANVKVPGSAVKANGGIRMMGSAEAVQAAQTAQLKEDFYSDLTGLIVRGIKRNSEDDVYDCIQTGRNGTLHFKLAVANEKSSESYDDAQCVYVPQLDPSRDRDLMDMLPDYLVEEITFPRPHAAKFYGRVVKALTEKIAID